MWVEGGIIRIVYICMNICTSSYTESYDIYYVLVLFVPKHRFAGAK